MYFSQFVKTARPRKIEYLHERERLPYREAPQCLGKFRALRKLTISWGGCSYHAENNPNPLKGLLTIKPSLPPPSLPFKLQKMDLRCFHETSVPSWLRPANLKELKKLYIRGGKLSDLRQVQECNEEEGKLTVLSKLEVDWRELGILFPKLIYLHKVKYPEFTNFPCDDGVWIDKKDIDQAQPVEKHD